MSRSFLPLRTMVSLPLAALLVLGGCDLIGDSGPLKVAIIGTNLKMTDPDQGRPTPVAQSLLSATAQGLVSFDGNGQIEPGLAERWIVTDDGLSYIFRIRDARWANGTPVTTAQVAALVSAHLRPRTKNRYASEISGVQSIRAMTSEVVEIRLARPLPHLLDILAQPDMALLRGGRGWGPMVASDNKDGLSLREKAEPSATDSDEIVAEEGQQIELVARSATKALARYRSGNADVILGGRFNDYPYLTASDIESRRIIVDPAEGMFGLVVTNGDGLLSKAEVRRAMSMAIRRSEITRLFGEPSWTPMWSIRPPLDKQDPLFAPVLPGAASLPEETRLAEARRIVSEQTSEEARAVPLRIALPDGPGADLLFAQLNADFRRIGLKAVKVKQSAAADLRLIDEVAPSRDPFWYLRHLSCARGNLCNSLADAKLAEAASYTNPAQRAAFLLEAETMLLETGSYIPLAEPLRWSVTSPRSRELKPNPRARHPLNRLVAIPS